VLDCFKGEGKDSSYVVVHGAGRGLLDDTRCHHQRSF
jgi:hypothetical protein